MKDKLKPNPLPDLNQSTEVEQLFELERKLIDAIWDTENIEMQCLFIEWQEQRNVCNKAFHEFMDKLKEALTKEKP